MFSHDNLKKIRLEYGYSQTKIAKYIGVTRSAYSSWEVGTYQPNSKNLKKLAEFYNVDIDYFESDYEIVHKYLRLNELNRYKLMNYANELYSSQLTLYRVHAELSAGKGEWYDENSGYETVYFDKNISHDIASWIKGDSMEPKYRDGDVALIKNTGFDFDGQVYAVVYRENTYIKKVYLESEKIRLVSINKKYDDILASIDEVRVVGLVVDSFRPMEK